MTISMEPKQYCRTWRSISQVHPALRLVFFLIGLSIGFTASIYFKTISYYLQASLTSMSTPMMTIQSVVLPPSPSPPSPLPPPPPPQPSSATATSNAGAVGSNRYVRILDETLMQNVSDEELLFKASRVPGQVPEELVPKLAFMFLVKGKLPFAPLWERFFKGHEGFYNIYLHTNPSHKDSWPPHSVFYGRRIFSQQVIWGTSSMVDAERRLLARALLDDPSNQRFVLLSESCIPLFDFNTVHGYLTNAGLSMVQSYDLPGRDSRDRYNRSMSPLINVSDWRKGSQWFEARRDLAVRVVSDHKFYRVFQESCHPRCYVDEHYIPTLSNILYPHLISNRSVTYVDWSKRGPHPARFGPENVTMEFLNGIRYGLECVYNGQNTSLCFLFARKFLPSALTPLLKFAPMFLGYVPS